MIEDARGIAWQEAANAAWTEAVELATEHGTAPIDEYRPPALPDWEELRPAGVKRELLGAFLVDREAELVHSIAAAALSCRIDAIRSGTFYHFGHEVPDDVARCGVCLPA